MKRFILFFILHFVSVTVAFTQTWVEQTSGVTTQLTSVSAVSDAVVWICGYSGVVLRTTDGGANWINVAGAPIPTTLNLHNIFGIDSNTAVVCGSGTSAFLFRTTNAGANWTQVFSQVGGFLNSVWFGNAQAGFMYGDPVGGRWSLWGTIDGGVTWDSSSFYLPQSGTEAGWNNAMFFDINAGLWIGTNNARVYKTFSLVSWTPQTTTGQVNSYAVWFNSSISGMTGGTALLITSNGGSVWTPTSSSLPGTANISGITGINSSWWVTRMATAIYFSSNYGVSWTTQYTAPAGNYRHISRPLISGFTALYACRTNGGISKGTITVGITPLSGEIPQGYSLEQNFPNPFNPVTTIRLNVPKNGFISLKVYDEIGREIKSLVEQVLKPGKYEINWNASGLTSGVYFYRLRTTDYSETKKMILAK